MIRVTIHKCIHLHSQRQREREREQRKQNVKMIDWFGIDRLRIQLPPFESSSFSVLNFFRRSVGRSHSLSHSTITLTSKVISLMAFIRFHFSLKSILNTKQPIYCQHKIVCHTITTTTEQQLPNIKSQREFE